MSLIDWIFLEEFIYFPKEKHDVKTTPQTFINGERIGGYDDLRRHFGKKVRDKLSPSYCTFCSYCANGNGDKLCFLWQPVCARCFKPVYCL
ncbi:protein of unknown function [Legionella fallonii LLAP-10]|uniref:Uncharacterized protein n=1 Tax=Legionella fallonii LLAP-10 TaxID=1212491 RepID=A0A098G6K3_9GAMM|nr:protein of unknown function [Legionella fallonii LLAP-10]